jgi:hypothetical protein
MNLIVIINYDCMQVGFFFEHCRSVSNFLLQYDTQKETTLWKNINDIDAT